MLMYVPLYTGLSGPITFLNPTFSSIFFNIYIIFLYAIRILPRPRKTTIYMPDAEAEMLTDYQADCIPPVEQMTEINLQHVEREYSEYSYMNGKGWRLHEDAG